MKEFEYSVAANKFFSGAVKALEKKYACRRYGSKIASRAGFFMSAFDSYECGELCILSTRQWPWLSRHMAKPCPVRCSLGVSRE